MNSPRHDSWSEPWMWARRRFLAQCLQRGATGLATPALMSLLGDASVTSTNNGHSSVTATPTFGPHFPPKAKRIIYLLQSGAPSHLDLFDPKPRLRDENGKQLPESVRRGQRLTGMSAHQTSIPLAGSHFDFAQHGESGAWVSELLPHTASIADRLCFVKSMFTEAINHDPAVTFFQTGSQLAGRPSLGSWLSYGLGSENQDLPAFVVLVTPGQGGQPLYSRLWGSGFLDSRHQGVRFRSGREAILFFSNPEGLSRATRRRTLDRLRRLDELVARDEDDPEIASRLAQYELAFRMQASIPDVTDIASEPDEVFELYGEDARTPGTFAANCLMARRLVERGVRFVQLYHQGWDHHSNLPSSIRPQCKEVDQSSAALVKDLERRGMLEDTLVVWGGEFGRTPYSQGRLTKTNYGRDHHPRCFTVWLAGAGVRAGTSYGRTDDYGYNIADADGRPIAPTKHHFTPGAVHVHDLQATILHLLGFDHRRLTHKHQGRRFRLTDVHGHVVHDLLA